MRPDQCKRLQEIVSMIQLLGHFCKAPYFNERHFFIGVLYAFYRPKYKTRSLRTAESCYQHDWTYRRGNLPPVLPWNYNYQTRPENLWVYAGVSRAKAIEASLYSRWANRNNICISVGKLSWPNALETGNVLYTVEQCRLKRATWFDTQQPNFT